jgi:PHP family Zn ribbon phosphoesterase
MSYFVTPKVETCYSCHRGTARPRLQETRTATEIIVEAKWVCPNCGSPFKHGVVEKRPITNAKK